MSNEEIKSNIEAKSRTITSKEAERQKLAREMAEWEKNNRVTVLPGPVETLEAMSAGKREATLGDVGRGNAAAVGIGIEEAERARARRTAKRGGKMGEAGRRDRRLKEAAHGI